MTFIITRHDVDQNTQEWLDLRLGTPTASRFPDVLAKGGGLTRAKYARQLACERFTQQPAAPFMGNAHTERGKEQEPKIMELFCERTGLEAVPGAFWTAHHVDGWKIGASPDSLIGDDEGAEVKSKLPEIHLKALLDDKVPPEHIAQLQGSMLVTGRRRWHYIQQSPGLPVLYKVVERNDAYISILAEELAEFDAEVNALVERIKDMF